MMPTGFGDDQDDQMVSVGTKFVSRSDLLADHCEDVDQYHTGFAEWKGQLFSRLGVDKAHRSSAKTLLDLHVPVDLPKFLKRCTKHHKAI